MRADAAMAPGTGLGTHPWLPLDGCDFAISRGAVDFSLAELPYLDGSDRTRLQAPDDDPLSPPAAAGVHACGALAGPWTWLATIGHTLVCTMRCVVQWTCSCLSFSFVSFFHFSQRDTVDAVNIARLVIVLPSDQNKFRLCSRDLTGLPRTATIAVFPESGKDMCACF